MSTTNTTTTTTAATTKTVYLIRHAESEENRRLASLGTVWSRVSRLQVPKSSDVWASAYLLNVAAQVDSSVSTVGRAQIANVAQQLQQDSFVEKNYIALVVHSPLQRAQETCEGMLQLHALSGDVTDNVRVVSLDELREKTPAEWIPGNAASLRRRIDAWESWLAVQPETSVAVVGHSQFLKNMLNLTYKFANCDVYKVEFDFTKKTSTTTDDVALAKNVLPPQWSGLERLYQCKIDTSADAAAQETTMPTSNGTTPDSATNSQ